MPFLPVIGTQEQTKLHFWGILASAKKPLEVFVIFQYTEGGLNILKPLTSMHHLLFRE
jgi:hypothetical protein